ncbi:MAG TPA: HD domain-containing protein [Bacillota bacterium]|nr:HD domain-containing protein [Bacillota bacterium]
MSLPTRDQAWQLLNEYTQKPGLIKHALAVEAGMRAYAPRYGGAPDLWGIVGLLHDFDYERYPTIPDHPMQGSKILREHGYPEDVIRAIQTHAPAGVGPERQTDMERALFACDELSGLITATALVMPSKNLADVEVANVRKKMKDKTFARGVNREDVTGGAAELGLELDEHIGFMIQAMRGVAGELGLAG